MQFSDIKKLRTLGSVYFVYLFLYSGLEFTLTFLTHNKFGYTSMQQGWMFFGIGITMALLQGGWVRRIPPERTTKTATMVNQFSYYIQMYVINFFIYFYRVFC